MDQIDNISLNETNTISGSKILQEKPTMLIALGFMIAAATTIITVVANRVRVKTINALRQKIHVRPETSESFSTAQAMWFPVTGSCVLFGLYTALKYLPKDWIQRFMLGYLSLASVGGLVMFLRPTIGSSIPIGSTCIGIAGLYCFSESWILNNIMAFALCVVTMEVVHLRSLITGTILLSGLFFYDIFWVFGTDVMVTVATNIKGPIKLLFPKNIFDGEWKECTLLGLGDIVIPGFFIIQVLRMSLLRSNGKSEFYFNIAIVAYVLSLVNTMSIMVFFNHAQPALLYIVPYLLVAVFGAAAYRGEFREVFNFDEEAHEKKRLELEDSVSREGSVAASTEKAKQHEKETSSSQEKEEEPSFWYELSQGVLAIFGQDDEYLKEIGILKVQANKKSKKE